MRTVLVSAAVTALLATAPACAATVGVALGPNSGPATQTCTGDTGFRSDPTFVHASAVCFRADVGSAGASGTASVGHVGARTDAVSINDDSLFAGNAATAVYTDFVTFSGAAPGAATTDVSINLLLDGVLNAAQAAGGAQANISGFVILDQSQFRFSFTRAGDGSTFGSSDFTGVGDIFGTLPGLSLRTPTVTVAVNGPVMLRLQLESSASAGGRFSSALSGFDSSFKFASGPVFNLADGITANAGDYLVNNRFLDPLAAPAAAPEPSAWALMILGFGLAGAACRLRALV